MGMSKKCSKCGQTKPTADYHKRAASSDGLETACKVCKNAAQAKRDQAKSEANDKAAAKILADADARARRLASDTEQLKPEDFDDEYDVGVGNVDSKEARKASSTASKEKRQEYNAEMGAHAENLKQAARSAPANGGDVLGSMSGRSGSYVAKLAEQERRFQNRSLARTVSLAQASEALNMRMMKQVAAEFFHDKIEATGFAAHRPSKPAKRSAVLLLSDLHLGAELSSLDEPMPFRAVEEARRLEYILRETIDYKPRYRENTELVLCLNGDMIEGQLMHQIGAGAPLTEQKAIFWTYFRRFIAECAHAFPSVRVFCQPGNHGRDKVRHPGRATWRKWDGHETEMYWALREMSSSLANVTWSIDFRAVTAVPLHGQILGLTHGDTDIQIAHPDRSKDNMRSLDRVNATNVWGHQFDGWAFGHYHSPRYIPGKPAQIFNASMIPPNGHARSSGYIGEAMGAFLWESVVGHVIGDVRFLEVNASHDRDETLGKIIKPFRFPLGAE